MSYTANIHTQVQIRRNCLVGLIQQQLLPCSKALRVQHDRPQTIQGQPFEKDIFSPAE